MSESTLSVAVMGAVAQTAASTIVPAREIRTAAAVGAGALPADATLPAAHRGALRSETVQPVQTFIERLTTRIAAYVAARATRSALLNRSPEVVASSGEVADGDDTTAMATLPGVEQQSAIIP